MAKRMNAAFWRRAVSSTYWSKAAARAATAAPSGNMIKIKMMSTRTPLPSNTISSATGLSRAVSSSSTSLSSTPPSSGGHGGRFGDELEEMISEAGAAAGRVNTGKASTEVAALTETEQPGGEGEVKSALDQKVSSRAMKFRAMVSKLRPQKKLVKPKEFTPSREPLVDQLGRSYGLGRRKTSIARVWISLSEGEGGVFTINQRPMIEYFPRDHLQNEILKPLEMTSKLGSFHIRCTAMGGGQAGQAGAVRLGLARALEAHDPWLRKYLKRAGMMERDSRKVERKKTGLKKARKAPQWVKR